MDSHINDSEFERARSNLQQATMVFPAGIHRWDEQSLKLPASKPEFVFAGLRVPSEYRIPSYKTNFLEQDCGSNFIGIQGFHHFDEAIGQMS